MEELLLVLVGGVCSAFGGFLATWYWAKKAGKIKFQETIAERKVATYGKGLELICRLQFVLLQGTKEDALEFIYEKHGSWFSDNLILLPHTFVENWRSIRLNLQSDISERKAVLPQEEKLVPLPTFCRKLAQEAEKSILNELNLPEFKIKNREIKTNGR